MYDSPPSYGSRPGRTSYPSSVPHGINTYVPVALIHPPPSSYGSRTPSSTSNKGLEGRVAGNYGMVQASQDWGTLKPQEVYRLRPRRDDGIPGYEVDPEMAYSRLFRSSDLLGGSSVGGIGYGLGKAGAILPMPSGGQHVVGSYSGGGKGGGSAGASGGSSGGSGSGGGSGGGK